MKSLVNCCRASNRLARMKFISRTREWNEVFNDVALQFTDLFSLFRNQIDLGNHQNNFDLSPRATRKLSNFPFLLGIAFNLDMV